MTAQKMTTLFDLYKILDNDAENQSTGQSLWHDLTSVCDVVGPYYTICGSFKAKRMLPCVMYAIGKFHNYGFSVCALVCDGASSNLRMIKTLLGKEGHFIHDNSFARSTLDSTTFYEPFYW